MMGRETTRAVVAGPESPVAAAGLPEVAATAPNGLLHHRYGLAAFWFASLIAGWCVLRVILFLLYRPDQALASEAALSFVSGLQRDVFAALMLTLPLLAWMWVVPNGWFAAKWHRGLLWGALFLGAFVQIFLLFVEYFFFDEFEARFNRVALDYLLFPYEVGTNIWQSYPVAIVIAICLGLAAGWVLSARRLLPRMWERDFLPRHRFGMVVGAAALAGCLGATFDLRKTSVSGHRRLNEIANNGTLSFVAAAWTHHLDFAAFYRTMPLDEAYARTRRLLEDKNARFLSGGRSVARSIAGDASRPKLNVVILLEESMGSVFWGCLGRKETLTPEMDKLAEEEGMLFTNIYACGNRTVRGMEGVLSSFPPLPGDAIVKRDRSDNVETLARVLKRDGYSTLFLYGGRGVFDGIRSYAVRNGFDRFVEQKHFKNPTFTTAWGVCDEDLFARSIEEFRAFSAEGKPFFATVLTVSNHRPYTYPTGRIPEDPAKKWRRHAVKYADYALGRFFDQARREAFWTNTVFVVVADHGARVYGEQTIPIHSYEIPLLVAGPAVVKTPGRVPVLGSSLDVAPTVLALIGRPYQSVFFGRDLLSSTPESARAFLHHNRDIGLLAQDRLVVLGLMQAVEFYAGDPKQVQMQALRVPGPPELELAKDAIAVYQVADDLYVNRRYRVDP